MDSSHSKSKITHKENVNFSHVFQHAAIGMGIVSLEGQWLDVNEALCFMTGYSKKELLQKTFQELTYPEDQEADAWYIKKLLRNEIEHYRVEKRYICKNGDLLWVSLNTALVKTPQNKPQYFIVQIQNINQRKKIGLTLQCEDSTHIKMLENHIMLQAYYDPLTNLPNQFLLIERLEKALKIKKNNIAIIGLDLKSFKDINNIEGRDIGDELLKILAKKFEYCIPEGDTVARFGDDEFAFIINHVKNKESIEHLVKKIIKTIVNPFIIQNNKVKLSCSCGVLLVTDNSISPHKLLNQVEIAMQQAKENKTNNYEFFKEEYYQERLAATTLKYEISEALFNDDFFLVFQPIIELSTGKIAKIEALIRWQHPKRGLISPESFLDIARKSKQILEIDNWVITQVCAYLTNNLNKHKLPVITVNITAAQLLDSNFIQYITQDVEPEIRKKICLEILESEFVEHSEAIIEAFRKLKYEKIKVAIDDFGAGYSSLTYLRDFPFDYLKLDRSLMNHLKINMDKDYHRLNDRNLIFISSVITLGKALGCTVIAEGVETALQDRNIRLLGCDYGQGFFYSPLLKNLDHLIETDENNFLN